LNRAGTVEAQVKDVIGNRRRETDVALQQQRTRRLSL